MLLPTSSNASVKADSASVEVVPFDSSLHGAMWDRFVAGSMNGTIFHTQKFLDYHQTGKFEFEHLLFFRSRKLVAILPGGRRNEGKTYESPLGSSYGSFVTEDISAQLALDVVGAFEAYVESSTIEEVYLTSPPVIYQPILTQNLDFALLYRGYAYQRHYISHVIDVFKAGDPFENFQPEARKHIRRVRRLHPNTVIEDSNSETLPEMLREFYPILVANKAKYGVKPTHNLEELLKINELLPGFMQLFLVRVDGQAVAGSLLFLPNERVALIFYHMLYYEFDEYKPIYLLMDRVTRWTKEHGYHFVDIGVSQDTSDANPMTPAFSLIEFKEKFDSRGVLRSTLYKSYAK